MYSLTRNSSFPYLLKKEGPSFLSAMLIAQIFFQWGNFSLELLGFLGTWTALSYLGHKLISRLVLSEK